MVPSRLLSLVIVPALALAACSDRAGDTPANDHVADNGTAALPAPEPLLDRRGLLRALGEAASAFAAGIDDMEAQRAMVGRRFAFRLAFGCAGDDADSPLRLTVRPDGRSYEARARFTIGAEEATDFIPKPSDPDAVEVPAASAIEAVEGFWVERPWLLAEQCPRPVEPVVATDVPDAGRQAAPPPPERLAGIAQFVTPGDSRLSLRGGRDYVKVVPLAEGVTPPPGLLLLVEGRLRAWPDGKAIECRDNPGGGQPRCLVGVTIDRVAFERADDRALVAEWTN